MTYIEALRYLYGLADFERSGRFADRPDVEPVKALLHELGDPHLGRATVHIAGSSHERHVKASLADKNLEAKGFTKYVRSGKGHYERHAGKAGPESLHAD